MLVLHNGDHCLLIWAQPQGLLIWTQDLMVAFSSSPFAVWTVEGMSIHIWSTEGGLSTVGNVTTAA